MIRFRVLALSGATLIAAAASAQDMPVVRVPPMVPPAPPMPNSTPMLVEFVPGPAQCEEGAITPVAIEPPFPVHAMGSNKEPLPPIAITFAVDASGRPISIAREASRDFERPRLYYAEEDLLPSFAASRFPGGKPHAKCRITYQPRAATVAEAPLRLVQRYFVAPHTRQPSDRELFKRLHPADTNCIGPGTPKLRVRAYPAFEEIPLAPGTWAFAMTAFDIDAAGKPVNVRIIGSDGNARLDRASIAAVQQSRFAPEARKGCTYPYYRRHEKPLAPPIMPDRASFIPADARCAGTDTGWTTKPPLFFPNGFTRRAVEGWAVIGYDVAPWGQPGNVRVLAAQPAAVFGIQAMGIVTGARQAPSPTGRTGCVEVVRFVIPHSNPDSAEVSTD